MAYNGPVRQVFPFLPGPGGGATLLIAIIVVPVLAVVGYLFSAPRLVRFEVAPEGLHIRGDFFYGRMIAASDLMLEQASTIDLTNAPEYKPARRTNGTGLPGYQAGWFRLANGEKALVFVGDPTHVVRVPVRTGYSLLLSVGNAEQFLAALRSLKA